MDDGEVWGPLWPYGRRGPLVGHVEPGQVNANGRPLRDVVVDICPDCIVEAPKLQAGQYYPRMCRVEEVLLDRGECLPRIRYSPFFTSFIGSLEQIETLFDSLSSLFRVAHPEMDNLVAYGGAIRDLIILACMEVECSGRESSR